MGHTDSLLLSNYKKNHINVLVCWPDRSLYHNISERGEFAHAVAFYTLYCILHSYLVARKRHEYGDSALHCAGSLDQLALFTLHVLICYCTCMSARIFKLQLLE